MIMMIMMIMRSGEGRVELAGVGAEDRVQQLLPLGSKVQVAPPDSLPQGGGGQGGNILGLDHHMGGGEGGRGDGGQGLGLLESSLPGGQHLKISVRAGPGSG